MNGDAQALTGTASIAPEFVIGVTGHRDIRPADDAGLRRDLRAALDEISGYLNDAPVRLACGMADGADMLAAEVALEMGIAVTAVLPMPQAEYEADFEAAALERFRSLLAHEGVRVLEIPMAGAPAGDAQVRDGQYKLLADYLTRRSNVLIAIWDGVDAGLAGGTSDVVQRYLADGRGQVPSEVAHDESAREGCGNLIVWLPAARTQNPDADVDGVPCFLVSNSNYDCYWRDPIVPEPFVERWRGFDGYARERMGDTGAELPAYGLSQPGDAAQTADLLALDAEFIRADQLARAYQSRSDRMFALFGLLAAGMGLTFLIYAKLLAEKGVLYLYIGLFLAGFAGFRYSARQHLHAKHLAIRALAETYRVQFFLVMSGAGEGYALRRMLGLMSVDRFARFEWLQEAVRCAEPLVYFGHCAEGSAIGLVRERWITDQRSYFERRLHALHGQHHRLEAIKSALLIGSVIGAFALIFFKKKLLYFDTMGFDGKTWLVFFMGLLPLWAAVWELYQGKMATRELLWQYSNQKRTFSAAEREIQQAPGLAEGRKIIRDLADKALIEIYLWSVHRYHREHEPPAAG